MRYESNPDLKSQTLKSSNTKYFCQVVKLTTVLPEVGKRVVHLRAAKPRVYAESPVHWKLARFCISPCPFFNVKMISERKIACVHAKPFTYFQV